MLSADLSCRCPVLRLCRCRRRAST